MAWSNLSFTVGQILTAAHCNALQENIQEVRISHKGPTAPPAIEPGVEWWDDSAIPWVKKVYDGINWIPVLFADLTQGEGGQPTYTGVRWGWVPMVDHNENRTDYMGPPWTPKNMLLNPAMAYWQRGTSFHITAASWPFTADRWAIRMLGQGAVRIVRIETAPPGYGLTYSMMISVTSQRASLSSGDILQIEQPVEGSMAMRTRFGTGFCQDTRLSFHLWATFTGRISCYLMNGSRTVTNIEPIDITAGSAWTYMQVGFNRPNAGDWHWGNGAGIRVGFTFAAHAMYNTNTPSEWVYNSPDVRACSGQINGLASGTNTLFITGVQFELGTSATPMEVLPPAMEVPMLERYFWKTFPLDVQPRYNSGQYEGAISVNADGQGVPTAQVRLAGPMRMYPSVFCYGIFTNDARWWRQSVGSPAGLGFVSTAYGMSQIWLTGSGSAAWANTQQAIHAIADAEIYG